MASPSTGSRAGLTSTSSGRSRSGRRARARTASPRRPRSARPPRELREAGISARKTLGQHFLTSPRTLRRIADAVEARPGETVVEIGAGLGALTEQLAERARRVVAVELDDALAGYLGERFAGTNVEVVHGDALELDIAKLAGGPYAVAGNLPYRIAQPLLRRLLEARPAARRLVVMVQAEVAKSIVSKPGDASLLGVSVQLYGEPKLLFRVPASAFYPPPKVQSAVVRVDVAPVPRAGVDDVEAFFHVARAGFSTRRKQLRNALANGLGLDGASAGALLAQAGVEPALRAQALAVEDWAAIARAWVAAGRPGSAS